MRLRLLILGIWLLVVTACSAQDQTTSAQTATVVSTSTTSHLRVADPNETIVVGGRIMHVSDLLALFSREDSSVVRSPRIPEKQNRGTLPPSGQVPKADLSSCSAERLQD